jgi:hypothetical protein|nr:MAG TPA: protein of unknown function DUF859 [Caudoviricetes sp.]
MASWSATGSINGNYRLELNVWENWTSMDNYSSVHWEVILRATGNYSFSTIGSTIVVNVDGEVYNAYSQKSLSAGGAITIASGDKNVWHNADGTKAIYCSASYSQSSSASYTPGNMSCGGDMWLSNIPRYANFTQHYVSARSINTVSIHWEADSSINAWQHSINGGGWQDCNGGNTYVISNLSPNTTYYIRTRIRRSDSGLWTESGNISATTYDIAKLSSTDNILILSNKLNYTYINAAGAKVELGIFKTDGKTAIINYKEYKNAIGTISFTESEIDTIYKMMKNNNDFTVRLYIRSTQNGLSYLNYKDVKIKINRCFKTCISASWR